MSLKGAGKPWKTKDRTLRAKKRSRELDCIGISTISNNPTREECICTQGRACRQDCRYCSNNRCGGPRAHKSD